MRRFTRLANAFSKKVENLVWLTFANHAEWHKNHSWATVARSGIRPANLRRTGG
jgi:hypothetical protein